MYGVSSSSAKQESMSWMAAIADWDFDFGETNLKVISVGPEGNEKSMNIKKK